MAKQSINNVKLGIFVSAGLLVLILSLYIIGKNHGMFGSNFYVKAKFYNVNGLLPGNNVRFAGIQAGTVKDIEILNDTSVEVTIVLDKKIKPYIYKNAIASIGTEGLMGNKMINIVPGNGPAQPVEEGDYLATLKAINTDALIQSLANTNSNIEVISQEAKLAIQRLNRSASLWGVLEDTTISPNLGASMSNVRKISARIDDMAGVLNNIIDDINNGKGAAGAILHDDKVAVNLKDAMKHINAASMQADNMVNNLDSIVNGLQNDMDHGPGAVRAVLKDSALTNKLNNSLDNIEKGTAAFNEDMEALKHNFLLKGYFKRQAKKKKN